MLNTIKKILFAGIIIITLPKMSAMAAPSSAEDTLVEINKVRESVGEEPLEMDEELVQAAVIRVEEASGYYSHTRPNGTPCFTVLPMHKTMAENLNKCSEWHEEFDAAKCVRGWVNSPAHYQAMVSGKYTKAGIAAVTGDDDYVYYALIMSA